MRYLVEVGLFESSNNVITCLKLAERLDKSMTNSPAMRKWLDSKSVMTCTDDVITNTDNVKTCAELDKIRLEKEKDSKEVPQQSEKSKSIDYQRYVEVFNETLTRSPKVQALTDKRKRLIKKLVQSHKIDLEKWTNYLSFINSSPECDWMFEERPNPNGGVWRKKDFDFIASENCYAKVKES